MISQLQETCLNCGRSEAQVPLVVWRYQARAFRICPDCMPALIHERSKILAKWLVMSEPTQLHSTQGK